ncbi:hypothetical protein ACR3K2_01300 [Cryptosporidium serpentis]
MKQDESAFDSKHMLYYAKKLTGTPNCLAVCHWAQCPELLSEVLNNTLKNNELSGTKEQDTQFIDTELNRIAVAGRSLLHLGTVDARDVAVFYNLTRANFAAIGWSRGSHIFAGLAVDGSAHIYKVRKSRHWYLSLRLQTQYRVGCSLEWLGNAPNLFALGFQDGSIRLFDEEIAKMTLNNKSNSGSMKEDYYSVWSTSLVPAPVRDLHSRYLAPDTWSRNEMIVAYDNGIVSLLDFRSKSSHNIKVQLSSQGLSSIRWNPHDNNIFAAGCRNGVYIWDIRMIDSVSPISIFKTQFPVAKVRWRPGYPTQLAYCCSAIDSSILVYDVLSPIRPIIRFSHHTDVVRDFDWLDVDVVASCGIDHNFIISSRKDNEQSSQIFPVSDAIYAPYCMHNCMNSELILSHTCPFIMAESTAEKIDLKSLHLKRDSKELKNLSIFDFCIENNGYIDSSLYSACGFLPDIGLTSFPGDLASIMDSKYPKVRSISYHLVVNSDSEWITRIPKLMYIGISPCWGTLMSHFPYIKLEKWLKRWKDKFSKFEKYDIKGKYCNHSETINKATCNYFFTKSSDESNIYLVTSGCGEGLTDFVFTKNSTIKFSNIDFVKSICELFCLIFDDKNGDPWFEILQYIEANPKNLSEIIETALENYLNKNDVVSTLILFSNIILLLQPSMCNNILKTISRNDQIRWFISLIQLLRKYKMYILACQIIKACPMVEIRKLTREGLTESNFYCGGLKKQNSKYSCEFESSESSDSGGLDLNETRLIKSIQTINCKDISYSKSVDSNTDNHNIFNKIESSKICKLQINPISFNIYNKPRNDINKCTECNESRNICCICYMPVLGRWVGCPNCRHGGHPTHLKNWFLNPLNYGFCPSGCGHICC